MEKTSKSKIDPTGRDMIDFIKKVCNNIGPRIGGSEQEKEAGNLIHEEMSKFCDEVEKQEFECHPGGFLDYIWFTALFYVLGVISYFFMPLLTVIFILVGILLYFAQQCLTLEIIDFVFPKIDSFHVIGKIKPKNEAENLVLLGGHHDSAYEFPLLSKLGGKSTYLIMLALLITILNIIMAAIKIFIAIPLLDLIQIILFIIGTPLILIIAKFLRSNVVVMGANDNLTAVAALLEIGKYFSKSENRPKKTDEEHMRGSKRFVSTNKKELKDRGAMLFNMECLSGDSFLLGTAETLFFAKHSQKVVNIGKKAAEDLGIEIEVGPLTFAGSDSANFSRKGLDATTLFGIAKKGTPNDWHTKRDVPERLDGGKIAKGAGIALRFVELVDESETKN